jgi:hypothetical protein
MIAFYDLFNTLLYKDSNISIHPQWLDMFTLSHHTHSINISCETNDVPCDNNNENGFEEEPKDISTNTMVQNKLSFEQIYNYFENVIIVAFGEDFKPLGLFKDIHCEKLKFSTLFFGQPCSNQRTKMLYQTLFNGNSCIKTMILLDTYQPSFFSYRSIDPLCSIIILDSNT